jgi:hypothetical protein
VLIKAKSFSSFDTEYDAHWPTLGDNSADTAHRRWNPWT